MHRAGSELALVQLDEVLGVSPRTVHGLVKVFGPSLERGDDIAHIQPLRRCLDARHQAPLLVPAFCAVAKGLEAAQLVFARERALHGVASAASRVRASRTSLPAKPKT